MQTIPFNESFEAAIIVSVLQNPQLLPKVTALIDTQDFYKARHKEIWKALSSIELDNLDSLAVQEKLRDETLGYFNTLVEDADKILPSASNTLFYAEVVKQKSQLRAGIELGQNIIAACYGQDADEAISELEGMFADFLQKRVLDDVAESSKTAFQKWIESQSVKKISDANEIRTGFYELDLLLQKLEGLVILAARPSVGKTSCAINIIRNVAGRSHNVLFFSLEQSRDQVFERLLTAESEVPLEDIRMGSYKNDPASVAKIEEAQDRLSRLFDAIHIDDKAAVNTQYINSVARQKKYEWGSLGLIVVDYLHIMTLGNKTQTDALEDAVKELRALGKELGCPVLLLSQLNRQPDREGNKKNSHRRPELSDLRSSGGIEQSADSVLFLYRESYYDQAGLAPDIDFTEVIVRKNRNGRTGIVNLEWYPTIQKFKDTPAAARR